MQRAVCVLSVVSGLWLLALGATLVAQQSGGVSQLVWFDRGGTRLGTLGGVADIGNMELSPDGTQVAVALTDGARGTRDLWLYDTSDGERTRLTSSPADENWLIWSPDGGRVAFNAFGQSLDLFQVSLDGGPASLLYTDGEGKWPVSWSPDGRYILCVKNNAITGNDIWVVPVAGEPAPYPLLNTRVAENWATFSPDGRWIAYSSSDTGTSEVYVIAFPSTDQRWKISTGGGSAARWRRDGRELFYVAPDRMLMAAPVDGGAEEFQFGLPEELFQTRYPYPPFHSFDVTADGQRFLVNTLVVSPTAPNSVARR